MDHRQRLDKFEEVFDRHFIRRPSDYERFAEILSSLANRETPWQKTFIYNLLHRARGFHVGDEMWEALLTFEQVRAGAMRQQQIVSEFPIHNLAIVLARSKRCAWPDCEAMFVPDHPARIYCSDRCRMDAKNKRRRK